MSFEVNVCQTSEYFFVNIWYKCKKKEKNEKFYGREKLYRVNLWKGMTSKRSRREFYHRATQRRCACVCICWYFCGRVSQGAGSERGPLSGWPLSWLNCAVRPSAMRRNSEDPELLLPAGSASTNVLMWSWRPRRGGKWSRGWVTETVFRLASLPRGLSFAFEIPTSQSSITDFTGLVAWEILRTDGWRLGIHFRTKEWWCHCSERGKKISLVASKGKWCHLLA